MGYKQLSVEEREVIMIRSGEGEQLRVIARHLGRSAGSISREIRRNGRPEGYRAHMAHEQALRRRHEARKPRKLDHEPLRQYVDEMLKLYWSPEEIAGRSRLDHAEPQMWVCHETVYRFILRSAAEGVSYEKYLRQGHRRHSYGWRGNKRFKRIRNCKKIEERPVGVEDRADVGNWESDTLRGPQGQQAGIATHTERKTRYLVTAKLKDRSAKSFNRATITAFERRPELPTLTFTVDNGMEFSEFKTIEEALMTQVYFATPYHAWERGTGENTNGLLRQFFPKGRDLSKVKDPEIQEAMELLNNRPRKCLSYRTPTEALKDELVALAC